ncbi:MAG: DUF7694 domain-containing protein [Candidatus Neomicrothrix subdominans]
MSGPKPLTRQRSPWVEQDADPSLPGALLFSRRVHDGTLWTIVADEPQIGWHLSISFRDTRSRPTRYPSWDEIAHARYELLPGDLDFVMHLPPAGEYVAVHPTTFHLHQHPTPKD